MNAVNRCHDILPKDVPCNNNRGAQHLNIASSVTSRYQHAVTRIVNDEYVVQVILWAKVKPTKENTAQQHGVVFLWEQYLIEQEVDNMSQKYRLRVTFRVQQTHFIRPLTKQCTIWKLPRTHGSEFQRKCNPTALQDAFTQMHDAN